MTTPHQTHAETPLADLTLRALLPLPLLLVLAGCLSRPALIHQTFAFQSPPAPNAPAPANSHVLALRAVEVSPLFEGRALVYRTGPQSYELDPYASFLVAPASVLALPLRAYLRNAGAFQDVLETASPVVPDTFLEVHVDELYGDFRRPDQPAAVLSMRFTFYRTGTAKSPQVLLQKDYSSRILLPQKTAATVVAGWDKALAEVMTEVAADLAGAK